jgi:tRNA/rRNA methyltransferase
MSLHNCRVVLIRTKIAANIGAVARVMRNMGLDQLFLVSPEASPDDREARRLSTHGETILENARIVGDLGDAVADCIWVAATSARTGNLIRSAHGFPDKIIPPLASALDAGPVAIVFGPEPGGLTDEEIARCHCLIRISTDRDYAALNLAQAAAICLYELRRHWLKRRESTTPPEPPAPFAEQERMFDQLQAALEEIHYLYGPNADPLMHALRHLLGRAGLTSMEVNLLFGLARQIRWFADKANDRQSAK